MPVKKKIVKRVTNKAKKGTKRKMTPGVKTSLKTIGGGAAIGAAAGGIPGAISGAIGSAATLGIIANAKLKAIKKKGVGGTKNRAKINKFRAKTPSRAHTAAKKKLSRRRK